MMQSNKDTYLFNKDYYFKFSFLCKELREKINTLKIDKEEKYPSLDRKEWKSGKNVLEGLVELGFMEGSIVMGEEILDALATILQQELREIRKFDPKFLHW